MRGSAKLLLKGPEQQEGRPTINKLPTAQLLSIQHSTRSEDPCVPIIEEPGSPERRTDCNISIPDIEDVPSHLAYDSPSSGFSLIIEEQIYSVVDREESLHSFDLELEPAEILESLPVVVEYEDVMGTTMNKMATAVAPDNAEVVIEEFMDLSLNASAITREDKTEEWVVTDDFKHLPSQELILLPPHSSLAPAPKLKNIQRLRTVHYV